MFIQKTEFKGFKAFHNKSFVFSPGRTVVDLGPREGRTSFIEALVSGFLPLTLTELSEKISSGMKNASIRIRFSLNSHDLTISKSWTHSSVEQWTVISASFKKYNLLDDQERLSWLVFFLKETAPDQMNTIGDFLNEQILLSLYSELIKLAAGPSADIPERMSDRGFLAALSGMTAAVFLANRAGSLQTDAKKYDEDKRQTWSRNAYHKKQYDDLRNEFDALTSQIQSGRDQLNESETALERIRSELKQHDHIRSFIRDKQSEIEKIDFEISTFESLLNESFTGLSPDEFKAIELKKKKYDELERRVSDFEGKLIERRHLEQNLSGLTAELENLKTENDVQPESDKRRRTYETEIRRIQDNLRALTGTESALQAAREELNIYVQDHHQYEVLLKARDWMNQNDRKKISGALSRAKKRKLDIENELSPLQNESLERKSAELQKQIHSAEQSLIHIRLSLYDLNERQKKIGEQIRQDAGVVPETLKTPLMSAGRYLRIFESLYTRFAEEKTGKAMAGFMEFAAKHFSALNGKHADRSLNERIGKQFLNFGSDSLFSGDASLSESEKLYRNMTLRILLIRYFTKFGWLVLDEESGYRLNPHDIEIFFELSITNNFEQIMSFKNI